MTPEFDAESRALLALLEALKQRGYRFVTPTPATHARVLASRGREVAANLRDVLGWSLPFEPDTLNPEIERLLGSADALEDIGGNLLRCRYRVSSLDGDLFVHSAYPTTAEDAVFFGPDSYRFADLIRRELAGWPVRPNDRLVDIGAGAGVGAIVAAKVHPGLRVTMTDVNERALRLAAINAHSAGIEAQFVQSANLDGVEGPVDIALANPPYIIDPEGRHYRDGGEMHGARVALEMAVAALDRLSPRGRLILYTGSAILDGKDNLRAALAALASHKGSTLDDREIDPDVFGEELAKPAYQGVERIALIAAVIKRPQGD